MMNRRMGVLIVACLCAVLLASCKSEEVLDLEAKIESIGTISEASAKSLVAIRSEYEKLPANEQKKVDNYNVLVTAEKEYDAIIAGKVDNLIMQIGEFDEKTGKKIENAKAEYEALSASQKEEVKKFGELIAISKKYDEYMTENIIAKLGVVGDVNAVSTKEIEDVLSAYSALPENQKQIIRDAKGDVNKLITEAYKIRYESYVNSNTFNGGNPTKEDINNIINAIETESRLSDIDKKSKERLDKAIKAFGKYLNNREKEDGLYKRYTYINGCSEVLYEDLQRFPEGYKDSQLAFTVKVCEIEDGGWFSSDKLTVMQCGTDNILYVYDERKTEEPLIKVGDELTIYGEYYDMKTVTEYEEGSGWFGSNVFATVSAEYDVPCIDMYYTSLDNLGLIAYGDPMIEVEEIDKEKEELINILIDMIKERDNEEG